jgi:trans-aconitate 2-methyltransferase
LPPDRVADWVQAVVEAYQQQVGEPGVFRFLQLRAELVPSTIRGSGT